MKPADVRQLDLFGAGDWPAAMPGATHGRGPGQPGPGAARLPGRGVRPAPAIRAPAFAAAHTAAGRTLADPGTGRLDAGLRPAPGAPQDHRAARPRYGRGDPGPRLGHARADRG